MASGVSISSPQFRCALKRLESFNDNITPHLDAIELAECGFYYIGSNCVKCFSCAIEFINLRIRNGIMTTHYKESKRCPFLQGWYVGNIPIKTDPTRGISRIVPSIDETLTSSLTAAFEKQTSYPIHTQWVTYNKRLSSFTSSHIGENDDDGINNVKQLAAAGFFRPKCSIQPEGIKDTVVCFCCGENLCMWKEGDDPWAIHKEVSPNCRYVRLHKENDQMLHLFEGKSSESQECDEKYSCKICMCSDINCFIRPCNHCLCSLCASSVSECPLCMQKIEDVEKLFIA